MAILISYMEHMACVMNPSNLGLQRNDIFNEKASSSHTHEIRAQLELQSIPKVLLRNREMYNLELSAYLELKSNSTTFPIESLTCSSSSECLHCLPLVH